MRLAESSRPTDTDVFECLSAAKIHTATRRKKKIFCGEQNIIFENDSGARSVEMTLEELGHAEGAYPLLPKDRLHLLVGLEELLVLGVLELLLLDVGPELLDHLGPAQLLALLD
jgi:hypothetical protein